jgi:hypothetical protein
MCTLTRSGAANASLSPKLSWGNGSLASPDPAIAITWHPGLFVCHLNDPLSRICS